MAKALPLFAVRPTGTLADNAPLMLYTRYSEVMYFAEHIQDPANVPELHNMRIAAKRLRYTLEIFAPGFGSRKAEYARLLDDIKACQEKIGDIHDCDIRIVQIREYLNQNVVKKPEIRSGLQSLIDLESATRDQLYDDFIEYWNGLTKDLLFESKFVDVVFSGRSTAPTRTPDKTGKGKMKTVTAPKS